MTVEFVGVGIGLAFILLSLMFLVIVERIETRLLMIESQVIFTCSDLRSCQVYGS